MVLVEERRRQERMRVGRVYRCDVGHQMGGLGVAWRFRMKDGGTAE